ncbi:MAG: IS5 family transposase [bacterium]
MVRREKKQISLADAIIYQRTPKNNVLEKIDAQVNWEPLRQCLEKLYRLEGPGRPAFPVLTLFKVLLLQNLYSLSDPATEEAIADRLSFRRFLKLNLDEHVPDHSTLHRFRDRIAPVMKQLFEMVTQQLEAKGLILKKGTLVDASIIASAAVPPPKGQSSHDSGASWTRKRGKYYYGYKAHVGVDQDSGFIRKADLSTASQHDTHSFIGMVSGDEESVYADKAYRGKKKWLKKQGIVDGIKVQATQQHPILPPEVVAFNHAVEKVRKAVERVFGTLKRHYHFERCRYFKLLRNRCHFLILCVCFNLKREIKVQASGELPIT